MDECHQSVDTSRNAHRRNEPSFNLGRQLQRVPPNDGVGFDLAVKIRHVGYRNARENSDKENARVEHDRALRRVMNSLMKDDMQLFKLFMDDAGFKRWLTETMFRLTYRDANPA